MTAAKTDILAIRNEVISYLARYSNRRQGEIAEAVGVPRELICRIANRERQIVKVDLLDNLHKWMLKDKAKQGLP